jgi:hypothetical protein
MNDEFEQRLARHALRAAPPEVTAELIAALHAQRADTRVQASLPRTLTESGDSSLSAAVWRTLGLLWASALAMLCWSNLGLQTPSAPSIRLSPEQAAEIRAERAAVLVAAVLDHGGSLPLGDGGELVVYLDSAGETTYRVPNLGTGLFLLFSASLPLFYFSRLVFIYTLQFLSNS